MTTNTTINHHVSMAKAFADKALELAAGLPLTHPAQIRAELAREFAYDQPLDTEVRACSTHADCRGLCEWIEVSMDDNGPQIPQVTMFHNPEDNSTTVITQEVSGYYAQRFASGRMTPRTTRIGPFDTEKEASFAISWTCDNMVYVEDVEYFDDRPFSQ